MGLIYGLGIYAVNMYGVTFIFPWFSEVRDWITIVTHAVFGRRPRRRDAAVASGRETAPGQRGLPAGRLDHVRDRVQRGPRAVLNRGRGRSRAPRPRRRDPRARPRSGGPSGDQPANVQVAEFIPQEELLPRCAAVVSHAGSGTFLAALSAALPQLLLPQAADQWLNAEAGASGGVALRLMPDELSVTSVRDAARARPRGRRAAEGRAARQRRDRSDAERGRSRASSSRDGSRSSSVT